MRTTTKLGSIAIVGVAALLPQLAGAQLAGAHPARTGAAAASHHAAATRPVTRPAATTAPRLLGRHHPDFNGDGYADLVSTAPLDSVGAQTGAGSIWAIYGGPHGANTGNRHARLTETSIGHGATSLHNDDWGWSTTWGDFNHDGYDDLAVGAPGASISGKTFAGEVVVIDGSASGLTARSAQVFTEATQGLGSTPNTTDYFGMALAAGDFNHDGFTDLAVGAPGVSVHGVPSSGRITELFGTPGGLSHAAPLSPRHFDESTPGIHGGLKKNDLWGRALAAADFNGDGFSDLAVGAPHKAVGAASNSGVVDILFGSRSGITANGAQTWTQNTTGVPDSSETNDEWGWSFATADFDGDGHSDLVIGAPQESQGATTHIGAATVLRGARGGLTATGAAFYILSNITMGQTPAAGDGLASSLAAFDFDGDGRPDLALGVYFRKSLSLHANAGEVVVLHNVGHRLSRSGGFVLDRDTPGMIGPSGTGEFFSMALAPGDFSGNGKDDLGVALPGLKVGTASAAGGMQVFYGTAGGLATNDQLFTAPNPLGGTAVTNAFFGGYDNPGGV